MDLDVVSGPLTDNQTIFLAGPPGSGKTTLAVRRLRALLDHGVPADRVLVLVPQRTLAWPYYNALRESGVRVATVSGLAQQLIERFWPQVAGSAGLDPERPPLFLTFETAQYVMNHVAEPFVARGAFEGVAVARPRLLAEVIDDLNQAAAAGFSPDEIAARLKSAWTGESARARVYDQVQALALAFRQTCLERNLIDWSLQVELLMSRVLPLPEGREALFGAYRHLIVDNDEENPPVVHDLLGHWLPVCDSALVVHDAGGGYRRLLGADPEGSLALAGLCRHRLDLAESQLPSPEVAALGAGLASALGHPLRMRGSKASAQPVVRFESRRFYPDLLDWAVEQVSRLVMEEGIAPEDIAVLPPFVTDASQFALAERLAPFGLRLRAHRPARALSGDPFIHALLTWARLAHPAWRRAPTATDVAHALSLSINDLDPIRARLLADIVYRVHDERPELFSFKQIVAATRDRIGFVPGRRYDEVWEWLRQAEPATAAGGARPLDQFVSRLVDEVLGEPGFGFAPGSPGAATAGNLVESIQKFNAAVAPLYDGTPHVPGILGAEYVAMVERGIVAGQYLASWEPGLPGVLLAAPLTFLLMNRPVRVQLWLDVGSRAWFERVYQPLGQPYVLGRRWPRGRAWTDQDEIQARSEALAQMVAGLTNRCRDRIYLGYTELSEQGYEQRGPLLRAISTVAARLRREQG